VKNDRITELNNLENTADDFVLLLERSVTTHGRCEERYFDLMTQIDTLNDEERAEFAYLQNEVDESAPQVFSIRYNGRLYDFPTRAQALVALHKFASNSPPTCATYWLNGKKTKSKSQLMNWIAAECRE
jgi:hypothetical protein